MPRLQKRMSTGCTEEDETEKQKEEHYEVSIHGYNLQNREICKTDKVK